MKKSSSFASRALAESAIFSGVVTLVIFFTVGASWLADLSVPAKYGGLFVWIFAVMIWLAFRAVHHAESLAELMGEPYGTIILTLSVICIEVALVATVTLTGKGSPTLARDTMFAVLMVVLNGMIGVSLLMGGLRHHEQAYDLRGANAYLSVLLPLAGLGLILPRFTTSAPGGQTSHLTEAFLAVTSFALYAIFLRIQTGRHRDYFQEPTGKAATAHHAEYGALVHGLLLLASLLPIVLLSKKLAVLIDFGISRVGAPPALGGLLVAILVLTPEGVSGFRASLNNELQRAVNLLFGSALSTIGLTIPAVLIVHFFVGGTLELGLDYVQIVVLCLTLAMCVVHFGGSRTTVLQGVVHLTLFVAYLILIFD
jgi:Ca2+:H+ antiporter